MLLEFVQAALPHAKYRILAELEGWLLLSIHKNLPLPVIDIDEWQKL